MSIIKVKSYFVEPLGMDRETIQNVLELAKEGYTHCFEMQYLDRHCAELVLSTGDLSGISDDDKELIGNASRDLMMQETEERNLTLSNGQHIYIDIDV